MKKFIAIAAIAIAFASCEEKKSETPVEAPKMDSPAVVVADTTKKVDTAITTTTTTTTTVADTTKKMEEKK